jgi:hypothetical protein
MLWSRIRTIRANTKRNFAVIDDEKNAPAEHESAEAELSETELTEVAGGINPQPLPPDRQ